MKPRNLTFLSLLTAVPAVRAQTETAPESVETADPASAISVVEDITSRLDLQQIMESGGLILYVLAAMSVVALALVFTFLFSLSKRRIAPSGFVREIQLSLKNNDLDEARESCGKNSTPVSALTLSALDYLDRAGEDADPELLRQVVEGEGVRQVGRLQAQVTYLMDIGVIAPMVGLLGTVMGMLKSFSGVALNLAQARPQVLADGVSQALVTTAAGLFVAIPAMMFYSLFRGRLAKLTANLELVAADIVTTLAHRNSR
jgi:biopolymer transport protein ExbB